MALKPGTLLGPYEVLSLIGAGGMGEVYKGRDTRLDRFVALKVLSPHLVNHPQARERLEREAHTLANLKHAHICTLYDVGHQDGLYYLVMEYLEGPTLAERLKKGPLPLEQALPYATELSDALDKAHRFGATHRDIKPGNIMLTPKDGSKLLDFGLAKLKQEIAHALIPPSERPTAPGALTQHGTLLGTLQYMAPEQVEGKTDELDGRTDVFAFGAVVYEMVTGKKAFPGETQASVIAKVLEHDPPPMSSLQPLTPPSLDRVVKKCLAKEPEKRWQAASDLGDELQWISESRAQAAIPGPAQPPTAARKWKRRLAFSVAGLLAWAATGIVIWTIRTPPQQPVSRTTITLPPGQRLASLDQPALAISPDGKNLVYVAVQDNPSRERQGAVGTKGTGNREQGTERTAVGGQESVGTQQLFLRPLDSQEAKPMAGTEGAVGPFFSPDGQWIGFFAGGRLKKVSVNGGAALALASAPNPGGASWSSQGTLALQTINAAQGLQQVSEEGGAPQPLTRLAKGETLHRWPEFLLGGKAVLFAGGANTTAWNNAQIAVQTAGGGERKNLVQGGTQPRYSLTGHLLYAQGGTLMAAPFDERRFALTGGAVPALGGVMQSTASGAAQYSVSSTGTLVYLAGGVTGDQSRLVWVSRNGKEQPLSAALHNYTFPRVSPDGYRVAVQIGEQESQIWVYDVSRDTLTRLTFGGNGNIIPAWSPDGKRIAFRSYRAGPGNLFWQAADGSGGAERLTTSDYLQSPNSFTPDGQLLAFMEVNPETGTDIWVLRLADPATAGQARKAQPFLKTPYEETVPKFSPDGKWLAYSSDESGRREIYVQPYPGPGGKWQISTDGGQEPVWNPNGRELFYRSGSRIMAVDVNPSRDRKGGGNPSRDREGAGAVPAAFSAGKPKMLFEGPYLPTAANSPNYDVSPDGQRFLMLKPVESQTSAPTQINVVLNWFEELKRRVPAAR